VMAFYYKVQFEERDGLVGVFDSPLIDDLVKRKKLAFSSNPGDRKKGVAVCDEEIIHPLFKLRDDKEYKDKLKEYGDGWVVLSRADGVVKE
jgi:hypothetical protein